MNDKKVIDYLKGMVIDGVDKAQSGHPGGAMSSMDFAYVLFSQYLRYHPEDPNWLGRDRFILSAGHESMLLYSLLHAVGYLEKDQLVNFRQFGSKTPGHPENHVTPGVECTTGPLGQGCAMSVGFAIASEHLSEKFGESLFKNKTWVLLGDGCMQEGVTYGAASIAGHLGLNNLIWYYDRNKCQISGSVEKAYSDNVEEVYQGMGWKVINIDGHDHQQIESAIEQSLSEKSKPILIIGETVMGKGLHSMEGSHETHGAPLSKNERSATKRAFNIPEGKDFYWPEECQKYFQRRHPELVKQALDWNEKFESLLSDSSMSEKFDQYFYRKDFSNLPSFPWDHSVPMATRSAFGKLLEFWSEEIPNLVGGSADLEPSNMTGAFAKKCGSFSKENRKGRNLYYGVREFPMSAISNGLSLYGGLIPFDATFLSFSDYSRPALRLGALQKCRVIHEFTHDSFYLGEDGPTHQPVEHLMSLRNIPDHYLMRPADPQETEVLLKKSLELKAPSSICLTRQGTPYLKNASNEITLASKGAWIVKDEKNCDLVIFASGSELGLALASLDLIEKDKIFKKIKVVSVPCWELFFEQDNKYQEEVLSLGCSNRVSIEAGTTLGWQKFIGMSGLAIGLDHFGASAPAKHLAEEYGFTPEKISEKIKKFFSSRS